MAHVPSGQGTGRAASADATAAAVVRLPLLLLLHPLLPSTPLRDACGRQEVVVGQQSPTPRERAATARSGVTASCHLIVPGRMLLSQRSVLSQASAAMPQAVQAHSFIHSHHRRVINASPTSPD